MAETSPNKLARNYTLIGLFLFAAPSILLQLWTGIYQIFDTAIATNFNSTATLSAINIVYPAQAVVEALAFLFSGGSADLLGKLLGEMKTTEANKTVTCVLLISTIIATVWGFAISFAGVRNGVERVSKVMMPILVVLSVIIAGYSVTRPGALEGVKYFLVPNLSNFSWMTVVNAMGQMFYSLSIAMGILVTFGSYMKKDVSIEESTENVEIFDTAIAIKAGQMIKPTDI